MSNPTCETCRWFEEQGEREGRCRRFPPVYVGDETADADIFEGWAAPIVCDSGFCGEHQPKPEEKE